MGLNISLMAAVSAVISWVVQVENGGFLNVLFEERITPGQNVTNPEYDLSQNPSKAALNFLLNLFLMKPIALPILESMPESLGGGRAGVDNAHTHPNREAAMSWITISLFLFIFIVVVVLQIINCCACCFGRKYVSFPSHFFLKK